MTDIFYGAACVFRGCACFYSDKKTWKYAAAPFILMTGVYCLIFWIFLHFSGKFADFINAKLSGLPGWLSWITSLISKLSCFLGIALALLLLATTVCTVYEIFGGLLFDPLVEYFEKKEFGIAPRKRSMSENLKYCFDSMLYGIRTTFLFLILLIVSSFFPIAGQILLVMIMGYCMGVTYMICPANNRSISLADLRIRAKKKFWATLGFGTMAYVLLMIPFAAIILLPGLVLGGAMLFNHELNR